jgi:cytosine/adenosine deaminase-related metal-dependent hydrolase
MIVACCAASVFAQGGTGQLSGNVVDTNNARLQPLLVSNQFSNVAANLVYAATGQDVTDVMIGGRWIVRNRELQTADSNTIWRELRTAAHVLYDRILK